MAVDEDVPAEVRAAQRALGGRRSQGAAAGSGTLPAHTDSSMAIAYAPIGPDIEGLMQEVIAADVVDILGVLPWPCAERLIELEGERTREGLPVIHPRQVRYLTPARDRITLYRHSGVLGRVVQRWVAGITGLRNWLAPLSDGPEALQIFEFDDVFLDCIVYTRRGRTHSITIISQLPPVRTAAAAGGADETTLVLSAMPADQVSDFLEYLESLVGRSMPLAPRQVLCGLEPEPAEPATTGREFHPVITGFNTQRRPADSVVPAVAVAICTPTPRGPAVLLKLRTPRNSRDDFGLLSLISERVLVEDLAELLTGPADMDLEKALEDMWLRAGQPETFEVPEAAFRRAAQRDLFMSCGLDISADRLDFRGTCLLDREGENSWLGFYVYRLDLVRSSTADELAHAKNWSPDLQTVPLRNLYASQTRPQLNRLLRRRDAWLREAVFGYRFPGNAKGQGDA
ncbi:hypothetical protein ABH920_006371 [Catenulispora sp. EB89]|uniref:hypothetical protein n=1 Tax=Catenulispora sp. EB89 TaxID=3156257 RepID=UPI00351321B3